jgi:hypothetical protein
MRLLPALIFCLIAAGSFAQKPREAAKGKDAPYFPPAGSWQAKEPAALGLDAARLNEAINLAKAGESTNPRSMEANHYRTFGKEPFGSGIGPFADRGNQTGLIIYKGYLVAQWGEPNRCDMTHSVTKSFLASVVGLAADKGLIRSLHDTVAPYMPPVEIWEPGKVYRGGADSGKPYFLYPFASPHNRTITWDHLLRQTSDWEGTLWDKPDWADRPDKDTSTWLTRKRHAPGSVFEYNDVRVNALALAATGVWRRPLPQVLRENIMDPIGASNAWRWTGYRNSWIVLDGQPVQSVSGGGHWGGGMFINAWDMARFGLLTLHRGQWQGRQLLSENFFRQALTPTPAKDDYGFMNFFLNTGKKMMPAAPENAFVHIGNGTNAVYVDPQHELVVVLRWIKNESLAPIIEKILQSLPQ